MCEPMQTKPRKAENVKEKSPPYPFNLQKLRSKAPQPYGRSWQPSLLAGLSLHSKVAEQRGRQTPEATESPCENTIIKFSMTCQ